MSITATRFDVDQIVADTMNYCVVPLAQMAEVRRDGPIVYVKGEGIVLTDLNGNKYLDLMSTHTRANSLGYGNREIADAVAEQMITLHYVGTVNNFAPPTVQLAKKIAELAPGRLQKVFFVNDGSEAVEGAIKLAKQYHQQTGKPRAHKIISRWNAYHGATMGAIGATDWLSTRHVSEPGVPGYYLVPGPSQYRNPFNMEEEAYADFCATYLERQIEHEGPENVAAFIAEPVMQANGVQVPPRSYFQRVREICDKHGVLMIIDEVICGFGRCGAWFVSDRLGIEPDIMTFAKALTAGYVPMGGVIAKPEIVDALPIFRHIHTFSGHAAAAVAANTVIAIVEREDLITKSRDNGAYFLDALKQALEAHPIVGQVRGIGMWLAVDFTADKRTRAPFTDDTVAAVVHRMRDYGVIGSPIGTAFEFAPPLITTRAQLDQAVEVTRRSIDEVARERRLV